MTDADELAEARAAYVAAVEAERTWQLATERLQRLVGERDRASERVDALRLETQLEHDEADEWAGKGFLQLVLWLFGRLDERRDLESSQALAAAARLATAQAALDSLDRAISEAREGRPARGDVVGTLDGLRTVLARVDPDGHARAVSLEQAAATAAAVLVEYDEAIAAVERCAGSARVASSRLDSARNWGTYDIIGGGFIASSIKKTRVQEALGAIDATTAGIATVRRELADIPRAVSVPNGLELDSSAWTFDVWFDNIFSDLNMQSRIAEAAGKVTALLAALDATRAQLQVARAEAARNADSTRAAASAEWTRRT